MALWQVAALHTQRKDGWIYIETIEFSPSRLSVCVYVCLSICHRLTAVQCNVRVVGHRRSLTDDWTGLSDPCCEMTNVIVMENSSQLHLYYFATLLLMLSLYPYTTNAMPTTIYYMYNLVASCDQKAS